MAPFGCLRKSKVPHNLGKISFLPQLFHERNNYRTRVFLFGNTKFSMACFTANKHFV